MSDILRLKISDEILSQCTGEDQQSYGHFKDILDYIIENRE